MHVKDLTHPMQPIGLDDCLVARFKPNEIICDLFRSGKLNLNDVAMRVQRGEFSVEDLVQVDQLLGYSVSGFGDLSYVPDSVLLKADAIADALWTAQEERASGTNVEDDCG